MLNLDKLSYWEKKTFVDDVDFTIIGAGIVGYSTAFQLRKLYPNAKILILERGYLPSGASSKNAGFACFGSATELMDDINNFGEELVWKTVALRWKGLQNLRSIIGDQHLKLKINGSWDLILNENDVLFKETSEKINYFNTKIEEITGEKEVYSIDNKISSRFGFEGIATSFYNRLEGQVDTASMNHRFHQIAVENDIHILFGIEALSISDIDNAIIKTNLGEIISKKVIICTNGFAAQFLPNEDISPARAQVLITKPIENLPFEGTFHYDKGFYYFRNIDNRVLFGGGRNLDFETETTDNIENTELVINKLKDILSTVILPNTSFEIDYTWSGIMGVGKDKMPITKKVSKSIYCGVRMGGMGVAIGSLVGKEISELIHSEL